MKLLQICLLLWWCTNFASCYFYPLCLTTSDKSCIGYFSLPNINWYFTSTRQEEHPEHGNQIQRVTDMSKTLNFVFAPMTSFYTENVAPFIKQMLQIYQVSIKEVYSGLVQYFPMLQGEKKIKSDSKLYFALIMASLAAYLMLYVYFTRKLVMYYQANLRERYLSKIKKVFQVEN